jgi:hypothetical protein
VRKLVLGIAAAFAAGTACARPADIVVERPEIRASLGTVPTSAAYLTIRNRGGAADRLIGASCACAASVSVHQTMTMANGVGRMSHDPAVVIPAGGSVSFAPGGRHLMLTGLKAPIRAGTKVVLSLRFEKAGPVPVTFAATDTPMAGMDHRGH